MAVTLVVLSGADGSSGELALTLDAPRIVIGRGESCDLRLPDPSVSRRHASLRQQGTRYFLVDEDSVNGTYLEAVKLPPQTPRAVSNKERVRVGGVWLEVRIEPGVVVGSVAARTKELALTLVTRGLGALGEDARARVWVLSGDGSLELEEPGRSFLVGSGDDVDLRLESGRGTLPSVRLTRRGDVIDVIGVSASDGEVRLDGEPIGEASVVWRVGQVLDLAGVSLGFEYRAAQALTELEACPDERLAEDVAPPPPDADRAPPLAATPAAAKPAPSLGKGAPSMGGLANGVRAQGAWGALDFAVVLFALAVLALTGAGALWLFAK